MAQQRKVNRAMSGMARKTGTAGEAASPPMMRLEMGTR